MQNPIEGFIQITDIEGAHLVMTRPLSFILLISSDLMVCCGSLLECARKLYMRLRKNPEMIFYWVDDAEHPDVCRCFGANVYVPCLIVTKNGRVVANFIRPPRNESFSPFLGP